MTRVTHRSLAVSLKEGLGMSTRSLRLLAVLALSGLFAGCSSGGSSAVPRLTPALNEMTASAVRQKSDTSGGLPLDGGFAMTAMVGTTATAVTVSATAVIGGTVTTGGAPDAGVPVALTDRNGATVAATVTAANGSFSFTMPYGTYGLKVNGMKSGWVSAQTPTVALGTIAI